jgi:hypothetical protein
MDTLHIGRLATRYRVPARAPSQMRERLDAVRADVLDAALDAALARAGVRVEEDVCVRRVHAAVRLAARRGDADLGADWSAALVQALLDAMQGESDVVRYGSRMQAWIDCAQGIARGDLRRAWAWRRLGLVALSDDAGPSVAAATLVHGLEWVPEVIVPVLVALVRAAILPALAARLDAADWKQLAAAALVVHRAPRSLLRPMHSQAAAGEAAVALLAASPLRTLALCTGEDSALPVAVLVALAADPAFARRGGEAAHAMVAAIASALAAQARGSVEGRAADAPAAAADVRRSPARAPLQDATHADVPAGAGEHVPSCVPVAVTAATAGAAATGTEDGAAADDGTPTRVGEGGVDARPPKREVDASPVPREAVDAGREADATGAARSDDVREADLSSAPGERLFAATDWGGLLLLLNVLDAAGVPDAAADRLAVRPLRWTLHQLALALVPIDPDDAAALAFCGLAPDVAASSVDADTANAAELAVIRDLAQAVTTRLREALAADDADDAAMLRRVCRRPATIAFDPGWIEVRFPLAALATDVRRCGLDLHPDWLPWLGAVVRIVYE